ncbi:hypothetical protein ACTFIV_001589 [Dictyostelium citrinum]
MDPNQKENKKLNGEKEDSNDFNVPDNEEQQDFKTPPIPKKAEDKLYLKSMISTVFESDKDDNEKANELMNQLLKSSTNSNVNDTLYNENDDTNKKRKFFNKINVNQKNKNNDDNNNSNNNNNNKNNNDNDHGNPVKKKMNSLKYDENDELDSILLEKKKESEIVNKKKEKFKF